jgi:hypothetical protein
MEEGVVSPVVFRYEHTPQERAPSPALTATSTDEPSSPSAPGTVSSNPLAVTLMRPVKRVDLLGIGWMIFRWIIGMLSFFLSGPVYLVPLIPLLLLLVLPTPITNGSW